MPVPEQPGLLPAARLVRAVRPRVAASRAGVLQQPPTAAASAGEGGGR